jgi:hypothetical protein
VNSKGLFGYLAQLPDKDLLDIMFQGYQAMYAGCKLVKRDNLIVDRFDYVLVARMHGTSHHIATVDIWYGEIQFTFQMKNNLCGETMDKTEMVKIIRQRKIKML